MQKLWWYMGSTFGSMFWTKNFGEKDSGIWLEGLRGVTPEMLGNGMKRISERKSSYLVNLHDFKKLCYDNPVPDVIVEKALFDKCDCEYSLALRKSIDAWSMRTESEFILRKKLSINVDRVFEKVSREKLRLEYLTLANANNLLNHG